MISPLAMVPTSSGEGRWRFISQNIWAAACQSPTRANAARAALVLTCGSCVVDDLTQRNPSQTLLGLCDQLPSLNPEASLPLSTEE